MDVRFFNFLARQPSAKLIERSSFCGLPKRGLALILANAMFWQPLLAQADGIAVSGTTNTTLGQAGNGVPIVNIAAPNANGLSHNQYQQYNVGSEGVILNNATDRTQSTQLGGIILGNQNLNGRAASTILNEVTGANATQLKGYTEVAGQAAHVIVANPYGISCNGCGFINTPQATLTTGKPVLDSAGGIDHFHVDGGSVSIDGAGLNADNVDRFDIITRSAKINAELHANQLNIVTGRNDVNAQTLNATALADDGSAKPQLAIDSSALGGMYAGAIRLVGTEAGVGVKLAGNLAASSGDIQIDANGQLSMAQVAADGAVNVKAASADVQGAIYGSNVDVQIRDALTIQQNIAARDRISLSSNGQLTNNAIVEAGVNADNSRNATGDVVLNAQNLRNNGTVIASRDLNATTSQSLDNSGRQITAGGNLALNVQGTLNNQNGLVSAGGAGLVNADVALNSNGRISSKRDLNATINTLNNQKGEVVAQGNLTLKGSQLDNRAGGLVGSTKALNLDVSDIDNRSGELSSSADVRIKASQLNNSSVGKVLSGGAMGLNIANVFNQSNGLIYAGSALRLDGGLLNNSSGTLSAQTDLSVNLSGDLDNASGLLSSEGTLNIAAETLTNTAGKVSSAGALSVVTHDTVRNQQGSISTDGTLALTSASLDNRNQGAISGKGATVVSTGAFDNSHSGQLTSADSLSLNAAQVTNQDGGRIAAAKAVTASVTGLDQHDGELFSNGTLTLDLNHGQLNNQNGLINAPGALLLKNLAGVNNQNGEISSALGFTFNADSLDNSNGKLLSNQSLMVRVAHALANVNGAISAAAIDARAGSLDNTDGLLSSRGEMTLSVDDDLINRNAALIADGKLVLNAASIDNSVGQIASKQDLIANIGGLQQQGGQFIALGSLSLTGTRLDNSHNGLLSANGLLTLNVANIDNRGGEVSSQDSISVTAQQLDNSDAGRVLSQKNLSLAVDQLANRNNGVLSGKTGLSLTGTRLDNSGGNLLSLQNVDLGLSGDLLNNLGLLSSEGTLSVRSASLTNDGGSLSSAGTLSIDSTGSVSSRGGKLITDGGLTLNSASLDNSHNGSISGKGAVSIHTGDFDNSHNGRVTSADSLELSAAHLSNSTGGSIGSNKALIASVSGLDQQGGTLFSNASLTLDLNHGQLNNQDGLINAPGALLLKNLAGVNNQNGEISSSLGFEFNADSLDNSNGKLLSNQALIVRVAQALTNVKGMIAAASLDASSGMLDNSAGTLTSRGDVTLTVDGLLNNSNDGLINAAHTLNLQASGINNVAGTLLGATALNLDLNGADLDNSNGLITTQNPLTISHLRDLKNAGGEVSSNQSFSLTGRTLDNSNGKLISNQQLTLYADSLLNKLGLISGWEGLSVSGGSLDNSNGGTLSSRNGNVGVDLSGALLNAGNGALVSQKALTVNAASVDNRGGILSSGAGQTYTVSGLLDNGQNGLIDSGAGLTVTAAQLGNAAGTINAQQALSFTGTDLDNSAGSIASNAGVTLDLLGSLTNTNGKLASAGDLLISRATQINNQGGQLASQQTMTLFTGGLDNSNAGTVAANAPLLLTASGAIQNANDGLIYSKNAGLTVQAASLANSRGTLQSQGALNLTISGNIDSQSGKIIAQGGDLNLTANNVDNRGGVLSSLQNAFTARITGVLKNGYDLNRQGGITQAQRLDIRALAGIDNYGGRLSAQTGDALINTGSGNFDNRNGGLYAKQKINVTGNSFDNSGDNDGQIAGQQIDLNLSGALNNRLGIIESDTTLNIRAASLDNQTGKLRALGTNGTTNFQIGGLLDNRNGTLETANTDLALGVGSLLNAGGSVLHVGSGNFGISTGNVMSAGGSFITRGALTLNADSWLNSSVLQAGTLNVNVNNFTQTATGQLLASTAFVGTGGDWINDGLLASDGSFSLSLSGSYGGNGRVSSKGALGLNAAQVNLASVAAITAGTTGTVSSSGSLTNLGRLSSIEGLTVSAGSIDNQGALGAGGNLRVTTNSLTNQNGLIFSGGDMALRVGDFTNRFADVYSLGNISIARDDSNGWASSINNISASIESAGDMTLAADHIENRKDVFETTGGLVSGAIGVQCYGCSSATGGAQASYMVWEENYSSSIVKDSASASMTAGRSLTGYGRDFLNNASTVSAGTDLTLNLQNFSNQGASVGDYTVRRAFAEPGSSASNIAFWRAVMDYNAANDPSYDSGANGYIGGNGFTRPNMHFWNANGVESIIGVGLRATGGEADRYFSFGTIRVDTNEARYAFTVPHYTDGVRTDAPSAVKNAAFFENTITYTTPSTYANAVVQAGGAVHINASQNLTNSVVREGVTLGVGASKMGLTQLSGQAAPTVVSLNAQLPPDVAQQQVDPTTLPGFSLPSGQNGLFRLSGQGSSQASSTPQNWSLGNASITTTQRNQTQPGVQSQSVQVGNASAPAATGQLLTVADRQSAGISANASTIDATIGDGLTRVQGLPSSAAKPSTGKYLIETNPVLTDLKQFMSSDYMLSALGYDPDLAQKRLGDGLYEQRLVQQAITARTGQAFIDGQTSNEDQFKYLMNNAIASKDALNLSVGVSLTSQQVAALTHDIVWLEEHEVNGEKVLVPVLYLAQADNRLAPDGALIAGNDVTLIAGENLDNVGTLKATNNLSATAGKNLVNSGLVQAGNRLELLAGNDLTNKSGGIIAGRDVSLIATNGDILNERTVTSAQASNGYVTTRQDFADSAARIEAANDLSLSAGRDITNSGALQSGRDLSLTAGRDVNLLTTETQKSFQAGGGLFNQTISQTGSLTSAGRDLSVTAGRDVTAIASQIDAKRDIAMAAKGDLTLSSAADEDHSYSKSKKVTVQEDHLNQVSTVITAGGDLTLSAGKDLSVIASQASAKGEAYLYAGENVNLLAAQDSDYSYYAKTKKGSWGKKSSKMTESDSNVAVGSSIHAGEKTTVVAVNDVNLQGSKANSDNGILAVLAGHDVNVLAAENSESSASASSKSGGFGLSTTSKMNSDSSTQTSLTGSTLSGNNTLVQAGHDVLVSASNIISTEQTTLQAGNNVLIDSGAQSFSSQRSQSTKKSGLMGTGGIGVTLGTAKNTFDQGTQSQTQKGSTIGSVLGDVDVTAGKDLTIKASDVIAGKDINLIGQNVNIVQAQNRSTVTQEQEAKKSGLTLALSGVVGDAVNTTIENAKAVKDEDDSRLMALQGVKAGLSGYQTYQAAEAINSGAEQGDFVGIALSLGAQKSSSKQTQEQNVSQGSSVTAGNNLNIIATGSGAGVGQDGDVNIVGSKLQAGSDMLVSANRDINLIAAANTQKVDGSNKSGGGAVGISLGVGSDHAGFSIFANGNSGSGKEKGNGTTWTETTLDAGDKLTLASGRDTTLTGAQASAQQVIANVGRDLSLTSLQDSDKYDSKQTNVSGGASFTFGSMTGSASLSVSQDKIKSNFESVQEQTGLYAGKGGYQVSVGDHTQLNGAVIASTAEVNKNSLSTGTLGWTDLKNQADFTAQHESVSGSTSGKTSAMFTGNSGSVLLVGASHSGSDSSTTHSAISDGQLTIRNAGEQQQDVATLSHDVEHANNALSPIFDKEKEQNRLREAQLIGDIGNQAMDIIRTQGAINAANAQKDPAAIAAARNKLIAEGNTNPSSEEISKQITNTVMQQYGTGSNYQMTAQAVTAALQGLAGGNIAQALTGAAAPYLAEQIHKLTADNPDANLMAHAVLGALVAQAQGNSALAGAAGASIGEVVARQMYPSKKTEDLTEEERQVVSALSTLAGGLSGAIAGGSAANAVAGGSAAQNAVNNNFLNQGRPDVYADRFAGCKGVQGCELTVIQDLAKESAANVAKLKGCWDAGDTVCVAQMRAQIEIDRNAYTKLKAQDITVGDAYQQSADFYADIVDNCAGKCGWLQAALEKTAADGVNLLVYGLLGGSSILKSPPTAGQAAESEAIKNEAKAFDRSADQQKLIDSLGSNIKDNPLRQEYEQKVSELSSYSQRIQQGMTDDELRSLAMEANQARRQLGIEYKDLTPAPLRDYIYEVNMNRYGDPLGPTVDYLVNSGRTYTQIIESAARPNPNVDTLLSKFSEWVKSKPDAYIKQQMDSIGR